MMKRGCEVEWIPVMFAICAVALAAFIYAMPGEAAAKTEPYNIALTLAGAAAASYRGRSRDDNGADTAQIDTKENENV